MQENVKPSFVTSYETQLLSARLTEIAKSKSYEVLTYGAIAEIIARDPQREGRHVLTAAMRRVERDLGSGVLFGVVAGVGVKLLSPEEQTAIPDAAISRVRNTTKRALRRMANTDYASLTDEQKKNHNIKSSMLGAVSLCCSPSSVRKLESKSVATSPLPLRETLRLFGGGSDSSDDE